MKERKTKGQPLSKVVDFFQTGAGIFTWLICKRSKIKDFKVSEAYKYRTKVKSEPKAYAFACKRIADGNVPFCERGAARERTQGLFFKKISRSKTNFAPAWCG